MAHCRHVRWRRCTLCHGRLFGRVRRLGNGFHFVVAHLLVQINRQIVEVKALVEILELYAQWKQGRCNNVTNLELLETEHMTRVPQLGHY